jgi:hypothetical protein
MVCEACQLLTRKLAKLRKRLLKGTDSEPIEALDEVCALLQLSFACDQDRDAASNAGHTCGRLGMHDRKDAGAQVDFTQLEDSIIFESPRQAREQPSSFEGVDTARSVTVEDWMSGPSIVSVMIPEIHAMDENGKIVMTLSPDSSPELTALINPLNLLHHLTSSMHESTVRDNSICISRMSDHSRTTVSSPSSSSNKTPAQSPHQSSNPRALDREDSPKDTCTQEQHRPPEDHSTFNAASSSSHHATEASCAATTRTQEAAHKDTSNIEEAICALKQRRSTPQTRSSTTTQNPITSSGSGGDDHWKLNERIRQMISRGMCDTEIMAKLRRIPGGHKVTPSRISSLRQTLVVIDGTIPELWEIEDDLLAHSGCAGAGKLACVHTMNNLYAKPTYRVSTLKEDMQMCQEMGSTDMNGFVSLTLFQDEDEVDATVRSAWDTERSEDRSGSAQGLDNDGGKMCVSQNGCDGDVAASTWQNACGHKSDIIL